MLRETLDKVQIIPDKVRVAQSSQKCYADHSLCSLRFGIGDRVFLRVLSMNDVMRFGSRCKLIPWYISLFEIF